MQQVHASCAAAELTVCPSTSSTVAISQLSASVSSSGNFLSYLLANIAICWMQMHFLHFLWVFVCVCVPVCMYLYPPFADGEKLCNSIETLLVTHHFSLYFTRHLQFLACWIVFCSFLIFCWPIRPVWTGYKFLWASCLLVLSKLPMTSKALRCYR